VQSPRTSLLGRYQNLDHFLEQVGTLSGVPYVVKGKVGLGYVIVESFSFGDIVESSYNIKNQ